MAKRKEHIEMIERELSPYVKTYKLYGGLKKKEKDRIMGELQNLSEDESRVIIATSKYVGEGFAYPILDTLFLTLPIFWSGWIKQYAGRLHRDYHEKKEVRIYDYLDSQIESAMKNDKSSLKMVLFEIVLREDFFMARENCTQSTDDGRH